MDLQCFFLRSSRFSVARKPVAFLLTLVLLAALLIPVSCKTAFRKPPPVKGAFSDKIRYDHFLDPPSEFRSFTFYSVNDLLSPEEISRQVRGFKDAGLGGFYLHSREGLLTPFLGDAWWASMEAAVETAGKCQLNACFYDEDKWPSGYAGGIIPLMDETFRARCLARIRKTTPLPPGSEILGEDDSTLFISHTASLGNPLFNGTCYVDLFNPEMVQAFLKTAYQPYIDRFSPTQGRKNLEMFSDEPHIHARYFDRKTPHLGTLSWSPVLREKFISLFGYDLADKFHLLFEEKDNWREVRLQYYQAVATLFEESFTRQIAQFCEQNSMKFSGHFLGEEGLEKVRDRIGNAMLHYRNMQKPGIDNLGLTISGRLNTARSLSSAANQYDIPERMVEIFGISGQNMNFEDRKWLAGWQAVLGVNRFVPHLTLYSLKGARKRDYPPTFSDHQPYWNYNPIVENYCSRLALAATTGRYSPQILVIHPLESEYIKSQQDPGYTEELNNLMQALQECHYDYDLGAEQILEDTAIVENARIHIGAMDYQAVILPGMTGIRRSTWELLSAFIRQGGLVFSTGRLPLYFDGISQPSLARQLSNSVIKLSPTNVHRVLPLWIQPMVTITGEKSPFIWTMNRSASRGRLVLLSNISHTETIRFTLKMDIEPDNPVLWDPSPAQCFQLEPNAEGSFDLELAPSSACWITTGKLSKAAITGGTYSLPVSTRPILELASSWKGKRLNPNLLTLDFASYSVDNGRSFSDPEPVAGIFSRLSDQRYNGPLALQFNSSLESIPGKALLVVEQPFLYQQIQVNSVPVLFSDSSFLIDRSFRTTPIQEYLKKGTNIFRLDLDFRCPDPVNANPERRIGTEIESIYLAGDFAVKAQDTETLTDSQRNQSPDMVKKPVHRSRSFSVTDETPLFSGDLATEGYPFYAGAFELAQAFTWNGQSGNSRYYLEFPGLEAVVTIVELNGKVIDTLVWSPFRTDITGYLHTGTNELKVTLVNSLRNLLGPHHHPGGELIRVGPDSFTGAGGFPEPAGDPNWYDLRKTNPNLRLWNDNYHHIPFGFLEPPVITAARDR